MSQGFYKEHEGFLNYAANFVYSENYTLRKEDAAELTHLDVFPIDGWHWFNSKEEAVEQLGVDFRPLPQRNTLNAIINP